MGSGVFRKKSLERVSSPEQLNDYIRVSNPSVWLILGAVIVLLAGVLVWGATGALETRVTASAIWAGDSYVCYLSAEEAKGVRADMDARVDGESGKVREVSGELIASDEILKTLQPAEAYILGLEAGQWLYEARISAEKGEWIARCEIVTDSVSPISFILG